jgi:hypothetical protein
MKVIEPSNYIPKPGDSKYANLILICVGVIFLGYKAYKKVRREKEILKRG